MAYELLDERELLQTGTNADVSLQKHKNKIYVKQFRMQTKFKMSLPIVFESSHSNNSFVT